MLTLKEIIDNTAAEIISPKQFNPEKEIQGVSIDSRTIEENEAFVAIKGENFNGHNYIPEAVKKRSSCIIADDKSKLGESGNTPVLLVKNSLETLADLASYVRRKFDPKVVLITGSNGKTTTKEMLWHLLKQRFNCVKSRGTENNHIGLPLTLLKIRPETEIVVAEIGTNHSGEIDFLSKIALADSAIITNVGHSHLKYFKNKENVFREKTSLINNLKPGAKLILNQDDPFLKNTKYEHIIWFGFNPSADIYAREVSSSNSGYSFTLNADLSAQTKIIGRHNIYNLLAAIAAAKEIGMSFEEILGQLPFLSLPEMRLDVSKINQLTVINDSYNANPDSFRAAIDVLNDAYPGLRKMVVVADMLELGEDAKELHKEIGAYMAGIGKIDFLISVGNYASEVADGARKQGMKEELIKVFSTVEEASKEVIARLNSFDLLLIKGSRGMHAEKVLEKIKEELKCFT